jgi:amino-acid N-acetyltransferase
MARTLTSTRELSPASGEAELAVRKAAMADVPHLLRLINGNAARGIMLPRTEFEISENLRDFSVIQSGDRVVGCAALHFYTPTMGEIRSLAVDAAFQGAGAGRKLMLALEHEAQAFGLQAVFAFTYIPEFFAKLGFAEIERGELPLKAWKDCLRCPKFQCCDEIAVIKQLEGVQMGVGHPPVRGTANLLQVLPQEPVLLPSPRKPR